MNAKTIIDKILDRGHVCDTGQRYVNNTPKDLRTLVKIIKGWSEYFYEHSREAVELLRRLDEEDKIRLGQQNIYIDQELHRYPIDSDTAVYFLGNSKGKVNTKANSVVKLYLFNEASLTIKPGENSIVSIECWNNSKAIIDQEATARVTTYLYDKSQATGASKITSKEYTRGEIFNGEELTN